MSVYEFKVKDTKKNEVSLADYKGKVLLIVNTATGCGFTPQYEGLQNLYNKYKDQGFEILDFPCNQFLNQAPGTDDEIVSFCQVKFGVTFKTFSKIEVNGKNADPLFSYLKEAVPVEAEDEGTLSFKKVLKDIGHTVLGNEIKWNFTKFLIDQDGNVVERFAPSTDPKNIDAKIAQLLVK